MVQGRDGAVAALMLLGLVLLLHPEVARAATYTVGDASGWNMNVQTWLQGKTFAPGDILVFNYDPAQHNVMKVDRAGYTNCCTLKGQKFETGKDEIVLDKGCNFFICGIPGHCQGGMKIDVSTP